MRITLITPFLAALLISSFSLFSQNEAVLDNELNETKWNFQFQAGIMEHGSDTHSWGRHGQMITDKAKFGCGGILGYDISSHLNLRLNYWKSQMAGDDTSVENKYAEGHEKRAFSFTSPLHDIGVSLEYHFLRDHMNRDESTLSEKELEKLNRRRNSKWSPYVFGGLSLSYTDPAVNFANSTKRRKVKADIANVDHWNLQIPLGVGARYQLTEVIFLSGELRGIIPLHDYLDGISESANPNKNDSYHHAALGLGINIGAKPDRDGDGISDALDRCPDIYGLSNFEGCPDTDGDGIQDSADQCPLIAGETVFNGCPDTDGDGIIDAEDACPQIPGLKSQKGCPTPDSDGDGVNDELDDCPNIVGTVNGCPDSDDDSFIDSVDPCPLVFGTLNGCPDSDGDGFADNVDLCPTIAGIASKQGCPEVKKQTYGITIDPLVVKDLYFETNSAEIIITSRPRLQDIAAYASKYPNAHFTITGFADNRNGNQYNIDLSFRRAERIYNDLLRTGIDASRLHIEAMGETKPLGDNNTEEGRQLNRRVEVRSYGQ